MRSVIFLFLTYLLVFQSASAQPKLSLDKLTIEYGKLAYSGENLISIFKVTNEGNEPLIISSVKTGDGGFMCSSYPREPIMPNHSAEIKFLYDGKRVGPFSKSGYIQSNANESILYIKIKGEIVPGPVAYFHKKNLNLGTLNAGDLASFDLFNYGTSLLKIQRVESIGNTVPLMYVNDSLLVRGEMQFQFYPELKKDAPDFQYFWDVYTNASELPIRLSAIGKVNFSPLIYDTSTVFLKPSETGTRIFTVECSNTSDTEIEVYLVSKDEQAQQVWFPSKQIYYSEGEKYAIPPKGKRTLILAYQSFESLPPREKFYFYAKNKKTDVIYKNVVFMRFKVK